MILLKEDRRALAAAARVAANVRLANVFLTGIKATNRLGFGVSRSSIELAANIAHKFVRYELIGDKTLVILVAAMLEIRQNSDKSRPNKDSQPDVSIEIEYGAAYILPDPPIPSDINQAAFEAFGRINGLFNCWPYFRNQIQAIAASMDLPFVLPTLRIEASPEDENDKNVTKANSVPKRVSSRKARKIL